jgi:KUP system potassium uptake protein
VVIVSAESMNSPHEAPGEQVRVDDLGSRTDGVALVTASFGFLDTQEVPAVLRRAIAAGL